MKLISAEERAELGPKGGQAKVPKGLASPPPKRRNEIARKARRNALGEEAGEQRKNVKSAVPLAAIAAG
jgi:hypothetical protein